jgi:hypothetical protein
VGCYCGRQTLASKDRCITKKAHVIVLDNEDGLIVLFDGGLSSDAPLALVVHLERAAGRPDEAVILREAIHESFAQRAVSFRRNLRQLFRRRRISLAILAFLASSITFGDALASYFQESRWVAILRESLVIGGWVAMWAASGSVSL